MTTEEVKVTREDVLRLIPQHEIKPLLRRFRLNRELIIGLIGLRGDGKSGSGACISLVDFGFSGEKIYSNMNINCDIEVDDQTAMKYGLLKGGKVNYASEELDKDALLKLDERYRKSFIYIDEINVQYSNVRRTMANTNVDFNIVIQELRKFHSSMGYSVIDEMFIDPQLRMLTDVFIKCEDTALSVEGLEQNKPTGKDFKWTIYPMSAYLVGRENSYYATKKALPPVYFHFERWRGIYNTDTFQKKGTYTMSTRDREKGVKMDVSTELDSEVQEEVNRWAWLEERAMILKHSGIEFLESSQLWQFLKVREHGIYPSDISKLGILQTYGITKHHQNHNGLWVYQISNFDIDKWSISEETDRQTAAANR